MCLCRITEKGPNKFSDGCFDLSVNISITYVVFSGGVH